MSPPPISVRGLSRTFATRTGPVEAVRGVDFEVRPAEILGLLGPNGAGKTTTLRMLATLIAPTAGRAEVAGADLLTDARTVRSRIGYVAQGGSTNETALVVEELIVQARLFGLSKARARENAERLLVQLDLAGMGGRKCKQLSGGQRRRVDIALGLCHEPSLIFLDEPTSGLDPQSRANLWDHIRRLREDGTTIVLTTHYLDEADALCDRLLVMDHGEIVAQGTPDELKRSISGDVITLEFRDGGPIPDTVRIAGQAVVLRSHIAEERRVHLTVDAGDAGVVPLLKALGDHDIVPLSLTVKRPSLDDVFLTVTGRSLREGEAA